MKTELKEEHRRKEQCRTELPEVYCERLEILRREIPHFIQLIEELHNPLLSYLIVPPMRMDDDPDYDKGFIYIFVDPRKHKYDPFSLVQGALWLACGGTTMEEQLDYFDSQATTSRLADKVREANCPKCSKNNCDHCRTMSTSTYNKFIALL